MVKELEPKRTKELNYLIVGYGNLGKKRHMVLGEKCKGTVSRNPQRGVDYLDVLQIPDQVAGACEAVIVTVPEPEKIKVVEYWLQKGRHVLVEKPFTISQEEADHLQNIAEQNRVIWYTSYNHRFEPHLENIKGLLNNDCLGKIYHARLVYGFGNAKQLKGTWRESGLGALVEVGCHIIDLAHHLLGYEAEDFKSESLRKNELNVFDYCRFSTKDGKVLLETGYVMWKNTFVIEIYGEHGSLHMDGLCKWGDSELIVRKRVLPAGVPEEERFIVSGPPDPTWGKDIQYFEEMVRQKKTSYESDLRISKAVMAILESAR